MKHKSLKMLQLLLPSLMTQLCQTFMITLKPIWKTHSTNLEHCFTVSMTVHSVSILSDVRMSSLGQYTGTKTHCPSIALSTAVC